MTEKCPDVDVESSICSKEQILELQSIEDQSVRSTRCMIYLDRFIDNRIELTLNQCPYHFTHTRSAKEIIRTKRIRLSPYNHMRNDNTEGEFILNSYQRACCALYNEGTITATEKEELVNIRLKDRHCIHRMDKSGEYIDCVPYVICFSYLDLNTPVFMDTMWVEYTKDPDSKMDDGICFAFPIVNMKQPVLGNYEPIKSYCYGVLNFFQVIYDDSIVEKAFKNDIAFMKDIGLEFEHIKEIVSHLLIKYRLCIKDYKFKNENEIRMVAYVPKDRHYNEDIWRYISIEENNGMEYAFVDISEVFDYTDVYLSPHCTMTPEGIKAFSRENGLKVSVVNSNRNKNIHSSPSR